MRKRKLKQKEKRQLTIFLRPDQWEKMKVISSTEDAFMIDVVEELIDLGLRSYYNIELEPISKGPAYLYDEE